MDSGARFRHPVPRRRLGVKFVDMWRGFHPADDLLMEILEDRFDVDLTDDPELLVHSCYGRTAEQFDCLKLFVSYENRGWGFSRTDIAITSDYVDHVDHYRYPLWAVYLAKWPDLYHPDQPRPNPAGRGFAAAVVSNEHGTTRNRVFDLLSAERRVASGGRYRNNVGGPVDDKVEFMAQFRFGLAMENSSHPGYATEKILQAFQAGTVPIYWGDPLISRDFNPRAFVSAHEFPSEEALVRHVLGLDDDPDAYAAVLGEPWFHDGRAPTFADKAALAGWVAERINTVRTPVSQRRTSPRLLARRASDRWQIRRRYRTKIT
jgi:hypothetical protein